MKRKASLALGSHSPAKLSKESTVVSVDQKLAAVKRQDTKEKTIMRPLEPMRSSSFRQRKAPSWLSSYITNSSQEKEIKKIEKPNDKPKLKMPRFPTLIPPSKRGKEDSKVETKEDKKEPKPPLVSSLRKQTTLKLDVTSPPASSVKAKRKPLIPTPSLSTKPTKILSPSDNSTLHSNNSVSKNKKTVMPVEGKIKSSISTKKVLSKPVAKHVKSPVTKSPTPSSKPGKSLSPPFTLGNKKLKVTRLVGRNAKEDTVNDVSNSKVVEICDPSNGSNSTPPSPVKDNGVSPPKRSNLQTIPVNNGLAPFPHPTLHKSTDQTIILNEQTKPNMLEVVICISTSGALREYLVTLQEHIREMIWRLQSLVPNLRIGVMAHTQGGIHDDPTRGSFTVGDHNYNRTGGHSGTKWLDLGATMSQICAFVDSLESESTVYPDYVQDNVEMALWKLQRCMSWSSCSYRSVVMIGRGRPNRTTFYHQKEHWRGWIRSALELPPHMDIPVIDWELEAKLLAEMGIHVFTIQAVAENNLNSQKEDEGTCFFRSVAKITQAQHVRIYDASKLPEIMIGIFCACHGSELLLDHRDTVRDENDGVLPTQLTEIFVGLQLHSKSNSLSSLPSMLRNLDLTSMRQRLNGYVSRTGSTMDFNSQRVEGSMDLEEIREEEEMEDTTSHRMSMTKIKSVGGGKVVGKMNGLGAKGKPLKSLSSSRYKPYDVNRGRSESKGRRGVVEKNIKPVDAKTKKADASPKNVDLKAKRKPLKAPSKPHEGNSRRRSESNGRRGGVVKNIKPVDVKTKKMGNVKAKKVDRKAVPHKNISPVRGKSSPLNRLANGARGLSKRTIKVSEKVRENMSVVKNGRVGKATNNNKKKNTVSPLKKEALKAAIKSQVKDKTKTGTSSARIAKSKVSKAKKIIKSSASQKRSGAGGTKRQASVVMNGSVGKAKRKVTPTPKAKAAYDKVSPMNRKKSVTPKSSLKTDLSKTKKTR